MSSGLCISTDLQGRPCTSKQGAKNVPYCDVCMKKGDPSMAVVPHPRFGKMLIAKRDLPVKVACVVRRLNSWG